MFDITPKVSAAFATGGIALIGQENPVGWMFVAVAIIASTEAPRNE